MHLGKNLSAKDEHGRDDHAGIYSSIGVCYKETVLEYVKGTIGDSLIMEMYSDKNGIKLNKIPVSVKPSNEDYIHYEDCIPLIQGKDPISQSLDTYDTYMEGQFQRNTGGPLSNKRIDKVVFMDSSQVNTENGQRLIQLLEASGQRISYKIGPKDGSWNVVKIGKYNREDTEDSEW